MVTTYIKAPIGVCFDLARSIDLHMDSMKHTDEKAIAGITNGLIGLNQTVTWQARHFGMVMKLTSKITEFEYPLIFADEMVNGPFKMMKHKHVFEQKDGYTQMMDEFEFTSLFGISGRIADILFLKKYMEDLIKYWNEMIKRRAEAATKKMIT